MERQNVITIELAGEPVAKGRPRFVRATGLAYTPQRTRNYESDLRYAAQIAMNGRKPLDCPVFVRMRVTMPIPASFSKRRRQAAIDGIEHPAKRPDLENFSKSALDAMNMIVFRDDSLVVDLRAVKQYGERPGMQIDVGPV
jgi:Holliday junction resolvase RusA-like endonuclease